MNNRRKFILQSGMAATAFFVARPFKTFAGLGSPITFGNKNKLILLHTGSANSGTAYSKTAAQIIALKKEHVNVALLHAGHSIPENMQHLNYDASADIHSNSSQATTYRIIYKSNIKIAVISTGTGTKNRSAEINVLAFRLKKEKNCDLVVCLSQAGYKNKNSFDDLTLAAESTHIDAIIGGHAENFCPQPVIAMNKNRTEVIINHADGNTLSLGKIEIDFDETRQKRHISFGDPQTAVHDKSQGKLTA